MNGHNGTQSVERNPLTIPVMGTDSFAESAGNSNRNDNFSASTDRNSTFIRDLAAEYDFCIILPAKNGEPTDKGKGYIKTLVTLGFELFM